MLDRDRRNTPAILLHESTKAGRIKWSRPPRPKVGSQPKIAPNNRISMMASQKLGAAMPATAKNLPRLSNIESRLTADKMPRGIPTTMLRKKAAPASCKVAGNLSKSSLLAGSFEMWDSPKSSRTTLLKNSPYCTTRGLSRPMFFFSCS